MNHATTQYRGRCLAAILMLMLSTGTLMAETANPDKATEFTEHYVMLYYRDLAATRAFYGDMLGLRPTFRDDCVVLYQVTPASFIGVAKEGPTAYHDVQENNAVMVSMVTDTIDVLYEKLRGEYGVKVSKQLYDNENVPIRAFLVADPGGYSIEFFQWTNRPQSPEKDQTLLE